MSRRKLAASEFSFVLSQFHLSFVDVVARVCRHSLALAVNAVSIFLVNRDLGASGVAARQITVINDLDYRYNQNAAEGAGPTMTKKGERGKKELLKNAEGMLSSSGVRRIVLVRRTRYASKSPATAGYRSVRGLVRISPGLNHRGTKTRHAHE